MVGKDCKFPRAYVDVSNSFSPRNPKPKHINYSVRKIQTKKTLPIFEIDKYSEIYQSPKRKFVAHYFNNHALCFCFFPQTKICRFYHLKCELLFFIVYDTNEQSLIFLTIGWKKNYLQSFWALGNWWEVYQFYQFYHIYYVLFKIQLSMNIINRLIMFDVLLHNWMNYGTNLIVLECYK